MQENQSSPLPEYLRNEVVARNADFLSSLPKDSLLYNHQGCWLMAGHVPGVLAFQKNFEAKDSDVFLITSPKSGTPSVPKILTQLTFQHSVNYTMLKSQLCQYFWDGGSTTWLKALVFAITNRLHYGVSDTDHPLLVQNPHELIPFIDTHIYGKNENPDLSCFKTLILFSTHLPYQSLPPSIKDSTCKIVYLCRNPKDTFVSYWHFVNKMSLPLGITCPIDEVFERFCRGVSGYGPYWDHVLGYWKKSLEMPENFLFLKYEDLKDQPSSNLKKLADFLGCPFSLDEEASGVPDQVLRLCSFDNLSNLEVNKNGKLPSTGQANNAYFRRGEVGDWKNYLTDEMTKTLDGVAEDKFKPNGLQL